MQVSPELIIPMIENACVVTHPGPDPEGGVSWVKNGKRYQWCYGTLVIEDCPASELAKILHSKWRRGDDFGRLHAKRVGMAIETVRATPRG